MVRDTAIKFPGYSKKARMVRHDTGITYPDLNVQVQPCPPSTVVKWTAAVSIRVLLAVMISPIFALTLGTTAEATTITVNSLADPGTANVCNLRSAIIAANTMTTTDGCPAGSGNDTIDFRTSGTIALASSLPQVTARQLSINGPVAPGITIDGDGAVRVMQVAAGAMLNLNDLTIADGSAFGFFAPDTQGGGIFNDGTLTVTNCTFSHNDVENGIGGGAVTGGGGAVFNDGTLTVTNSTFLENSADGAEADFDGGGIENIGKLIIQDSTFSDNRVFSGPHGSSDGGAISNGGTLKITDSTFSDNNSTADIAEGGGIANSGILSIQNSTFSGNGVLANLGSPSGGGISNGGTLTVTNSTFSHNDAWVSSFGFGAGGGGISNGGTLTVTNSTFSHNGADIPLTVTGGGGAIRNDGTLTVTNSTFFDNFGCKGSGIAGGATVTSSTFFDNIACEGYSTIEGATSFKSTLLAASSGSTSNGELSAGSNCSGTMTDSGYNISDDATCGFAKTGSANNGDGVDPLLAIVGLADNGGPTQTIALQDGSPAIDAIPLAECTDQSSNPITTDQRGFRRPDFGEVFCDIGAFESQETFAGKPRANHCRGVSVSALTKQYGSVAAAASALGFPSVRALQNAIRAFCAR